MRDRYEQQPDEAEREEEIADDEDSVSHTDAESESSANPWFGFFGNDDVELL